MSSRMLISAQELLRSLGSPELVVVDCRFSLPEPGKGRAAWRMGHIPGAVYAHLDDDLAGPAGSGSGRHPLPDPDVFSATLRSWGINDNSRVVAYDDAGGAIAARFWWLLRWLGHENAAVLDGGLQAWQEAGGATDEQVPAPRTGNFTGDAQARRAIEVDELQGRLASDEGYLLIDARDSARFLGKTEPIDAVAGHIPGAINLPFSGLLQNGRFRDPDTLRAAWLAAGADPDCDDWAVMCGSGVTACHLVLAAGLAGLPEPRVYVGSWSEWIQEPDRPIVAGPG